jgi:transcriptional regulator with XRE-family HTH domain
MKQLKPLGAVRRAKGLTLAKVAAIMKTSTSTLSDFESGKEEVTDDYIGRYAMAIKEPVHEVSLRYWVAVQMRAIVRLEAAHRKLETRYAKRALRKLA